MFPADSHLDVDMTGTPVLDLDHLARYTAGDEALEAELFALFEHQTETCLARMAETGDVDEFMTAAHTLKGAARGIGAMKLGAACAGAEETPLDAGAVGRVRDAVCEVLAQINDVLARRAG